MSTMPAEKRYTKGRSRYAVLGVLSYGPATGYEIKKLLTETTSHFWKESYGQIYPTLKTLREEGLVEIESHDTDGRETRSYRLLPAGDRTLRSWIRSQEVQLKPGRHELLLKLFFSRAEDARHLKPQVVAYRSMTAALLEEYRSYREETDTEEIPYDARRLIATTIDYGESAAAMQLAWCDRTIGLLEELSGQSTGSDEARTPAPIPGRPETRPRCGESEPGARGG